ncbi:MAG: GtrA family protein [Oscillospiraceae bacterium]|nr:GtrA family protein [Oscillospiraceae bacterium]
MGIENAADFKTFLIQFIKFGMVGLLNTVVALAFYYLFILINPALYQVGNAVGWIVGVLNSVFWNRKLVFKDSTEKPLKILGKSYVAYGGSLLLTIILLHIQVEWIGISTVVAPLICLVFTIPINFLVNKYWAFKKGGKKV